MITIAQLRVFWAVAHSESLTRAAKQLGVTQPSLSQQLAKLEAALGGRLFDRVNNQLVLTDAGRFLLRKAEVVLAELDEAEAGLAEFKMGRRSRIAIGALASIARYPYADGYVTWPGPNSNTFVAWIGREVPELGLTLPPTAIGKDFLGRQLAAPTPSGTGLQISLGGLLGVAVGLKEGVELNLLGLVVGVDPLGLAIKLPGLGRLGAS